jgi:hypothetical protein
LIIINDFLAKNIVRFLKLKGNMEKFGLLDIIEKLAPLKKSANNLLPIFENLKSSALKKEEVLKEKPLKNTAPCF